MVVNMYKHMGKVVIKILEGSAVVTNRVRWAKYISSGCKFPIVYMCQKLWKLAGSRQSYCKNCLSYFFGPPCTLYYDTCGMCRIVSYARLCTFCSNRIVILHIGLLCLATDAGYINTD